MKAWILGCGGWIPTERRETMCVFIRAGQHGLLLDAGTGLQRLVSNSELADGLHTLDIALTHFHLDHICGLPYVPALPITPTIWAPGRWLYGRASEELLHPLRTAPLSSSDPSELGEVRELGAGTQRIGQFTMTARAQERHWAPTAGLRIGDELALITDTAYDPGSAAFARGVTHLLHEAWSCSTHPVADACDATAASAGDVARDAGVQSLTLVHLNPMLEDEDELLEDARRAAPAAQLGRDGALVKLERGA